MRLSPGLKREGISWVEKKNHGIHTWEIGEQKHRVISVSPPGEKAAGTVKVTGQTVKV